MEKWLSFIIDVSDVFIYDTLLTQRYRIKFIAANVAWAYHISYISHIDKIGTAFDYLPIIRCSAMQKEKCTNHASSACSG